MLFEDDGAKTFVEIPGNGPRSASQRRFEIESGLSDGLNIEVITSGLEEGDGSSATSAARRARLEEAQR